MTRAEPKAGAQPKQRRSVAAVRFQLCANVFARSRIHFDANRGVPVTILSLDRADAQQTGQDADGDDTAGPLPLLADAAQITVH